MQDYRSGGNTICDTLVNSQTEIGKQLNYKSVAGILYICARSAKAEASATGVIRQVVNHGQWLQLQANATEV